MIGRSPHPRLPFAPSPFLRFHRRPLVTTSPLLFPLHRCDLDDRRPSPAALFAPSSFRSPMPPPLALAIGTHRCGHLLQPKRVSIAELHRWPLLPHLFFFCYVDFSVKPPHKQQDDHVISSWMIGRSSHPRLSFAPSPFLRFRRRPPVAASPMLFPLRHRDLDDCRPSPAPSLLLLPSSHRCLLPLPQLSEPAVVAIFSNPKGSPLPNFTVGLFSPHLFFFCSSEIP